MDKGQLKVQMIRIWRGLEMIRVLATETKVRTFVLAFLGEVFVLHTTCGHVSVLHTNHGWDVGLGHNV
jgi:hypothetical protein